MATNNVGLQIKVTVDSTALKKANEAIQKTKKHFAEASKTTKDLGNESKLTSKAVSQEADAFKKAIKSINKFTPAQEKALVAERKARAERIKGYKQELDTRTRFQKFQDSKLGKVASLAAPLVAGLSIGKIFGDLKEFDKINKKIQGVTHATDAEMQDLNKNIMNVAKTYGLATADLQHEAFNLTKTWNHGTEKINKNFESIAKASIATSSSFEETAGVYLKVENAFQNINPEEIANAVAFLGDKAASTMHDLDYATTTAMTTAKAHNMSLKDTVATVTMLGKAGFKGSLGGTAFKQIVSALTNPKLENNLKQMGLTFADVNLEKNDMPTALENLAKGIERTKGKKGGDVLVQGLLRQMFGDAADKLMVLVENPQEFRNLLKDQLTFKASKIANKQLEGASAKFEVLKETLNQVVLKIGILATPTITTVLTGVLTAFEGIGWIGNKVSNLFEKFGFKFDEAGGFLTSTLNIIAKTLASAGLGAIIGGVLGAALGPVGFALGAKAGALIGGAVGGLGGGVEQYKANEAFNQAENQKLLDKIAAEYQQQPLNLLSDALNSAGVKTNTNELLSASGSLMSVKPMKQDNNTNVNLVIEDKAGVKMSVRNVDSNLGGQTKITEKSTLKAFNPENY